MEHCGMADTVLTLTLEIIQLLTGEDYAVVKKTSEEMISSSHLTSQTSNRVRRSQSPTMGPAAPSASYRENNDQKILQLANRIIHFLTGEVWQHLVRQKDLANGVLMEDPGTDTSADMLRTRSQDSALHEDLTPYCNMAMPSDHTDNPLSQIKTESESHEEQPLLRSESSSQADYTLCATTHIKLETLSFEEGNLTYTDVYSPKNTFQDTPACIKEEASLSEEGDTSLHESAYHRQASSLNSHNQSADAQQAEPNSDGNGRLETTLSPMGTPSAKARQISKSGVSTGVSETSNLTTLRKHQKGPKPFSCSKCSRGFITKLSLFRHERLHLGQEEKVEHCPDDGLEIRNVVPAAELNHVRSPVQTEVGQGLNSDNGVSQGCNLQKISEVSSHQIRSCSNFEDEGVIWSGDSHALRLGPSDRASQDFNHQIRLSCMSNNNNSPAWTEDGQERRTSHQNRTSQGSYYQARTSSSPGDGPSVGTGDVHELKSSPKNKTSEGSTHRASSSCNLEGKSPVRDGDRQELRMSPKNMTAQGSSHEISSTYNLKGKGPIWTKSSQELRMSPQNGCFQASSIQVQFSCNMEDKGPAWTGDVQELKMSPKDRSIQSANHQISSPNSLEDEMSVWSEEGHGQGNKNLQGFSHQIQLSGNLENQSQLWSGLGTSPKNRASETRPTCNSDKGPISVGDGQESRIKPKNRTSQDSSTQERSFSNLENESPAWTGNGQEIKTNPKKRTLRSVRHQTRSSTCLENNGQVWTKDGRELRKSSKNTPCQSTNNQTRSANTSGDKSPLWALVDQELTTNINAELRSSNYHESSSDVMEGHSASWTGNGRELRASQSSNHHISLLKNLDTQSLAWPEDGQELKTSPVDRTFKEFNSQTRPFNNLDDNADGQALRVNPKTTTYEISAYERSPSNDSDRPDWCKAKMLSCVECGEVFTYKSQLALHQRSHTNKSPYSCTECGKSFPSNTHLLVHHRVHTGEKLFGCSVCSKRFATKSTLVIHQRVHTREKPYSCSECRKCFPCNSQLVIHQRTHTGEKPYSCLECGKGFISNSDLLRHRRVHTGERPFKCPECVKCFSQKSHLREHQKTHRR